MHNVEPDSAAVERRRQAEVDRHKRIFDTRNRVMGLDVRALEQQVAERRGREEALKRQDTAHDQLRVHTDQKALDLQRQEEDKRRELARELVQYRSLYQSSRDSRDADINYSRQVALCDNMITGESLGPASMQVFQGEGVGVEERRRSQMELNAKTYRAQMEEREREKKEQKHIERLNAKKLVQQDLKIVQLDALEEDCKRAACIALKNYNQAQAEERLQRERRERLKQEGEELAEVWHMTTSDLLTETPDVAEKGLRVLGSAGASRVQPDRWKGMGHEQLSAIYKQREHQMAEKKSMTEMEKQMDRTWHSIQMELDRLQLEDERKRKELEREKRAQLDRYNQQLAKEQQTHREFLKAGLYTNRPTDRYFTQFSTSSR